MNNNNIIWHIVDLRAVQLSFARMSDAYYENLIISTQKKPFKSLK